MTVKIKIPAMFQSITNGHKIAEVNCNTIGDCLRQLSSKYPPLQEIVFDKKGKLAPYLLVFVNSQNLIGDILNTPVESGDEILLEMIIDGG